MDRYLTVRQAADHLGVSSRWLYEQAAGHTVPHHRFGRSVRFSPADLTAIAQAAAVPARHTGRRLRSTA